jgi:hypothetical protein
VRKHIPENAASPCLATDTGRETEDGAQKW